MFHIPLKNFIFRPVNIQNSFFMKSPILSCYYLKFQQFSCNLKQTFTIVQNPFFLLCVLPKLSFLFLIYANYVCVCISI